MTTTPSPRVPASSPSPAPVGRDKDARARSRQRAAPLAWTAMSLGLAGMAVIFLPITNILAVIFGIGAIATGTYVNHAISDEHPGSHLGIALGIGTIIVWVVIDLLGVHLFGYRPSSLIG